MRGTRVTNDEKDDEAVKTLRMEWLRLILKARAERYEPLPVGPVWRELAESTERRLSEPNPNEVIR